MKEPTQTQVQGATKERPLKFGLIRFVLDLRTVALVSGAFCLGAPAASPPCYVDWKSVILSRRYFGLSITWTVFSFSTSVWLWFWIVFQSMLGAKSLPK